jgi:hypothetical protein
MATIVADALVQFGDDQFWPAIPLIAAWRLETAASTQVLPVLFELSNI